MIAFLGIASNYEGTSYSLPDCQADLTNVASAFEPYCNAMVTLFGQSATRDAVFAAVEAMIAQLKKGDLWLMYYSGHGTFDNVNGKRAEAIVHHDGSLSFDFEIQAACAKRAPGVILAAAADSCYSGGLPPNRSIPWLRNSSRLPRTVDVKKLTTHRAKWPAKKPRQPNVVYTASTGREVAYSTGEGGAWTNEFLAALKSGKSKTTLEALHKRIRKKLPNSEYPQSPTFVADTALKKRTLQSFIRT